MTLQMPSSRALLRQNPVCSIEELHNQSPLEELLLASDSKQQPIQQQDEDELFDFYITPYTERDPKDNPFKHDRQEDTVLRFSKKEEGSTQLYRRDDDQLEIDRLKSIIQKKNSVIGQLTEEITALNRQLVKANERKSKNLEKSKPVRSKRDNNEWLFLQKNNSELFESLRRCQAQKQQLSEQLLKLKSTQIPQLSLQITLLVAENKELHRQNAILMRDINQYIAKGKKQIKYINQMRDILAQKTGIKDSTSDSRYLAVSYSKFLEERSIRSQQKLSRNHRCASRQESSRHKQISRQQESSKHKQRSLVRGGQHCYSIDKVHRLLI